MLPGSPTQSLLSRSSLICQEEMKSVLPFQLKYANVGPKGLTEGLPLPLLKVWQDTVSEKYTFQTEGHKLCIYFAPSIQMVSRLPCGRFCLAETCSDSLTLSFGGQVAEMKQLFCTLSSVRLSMLQTSMRQAPQTAAGPQWGAAEGSAMAAAGLTEHSQPAPSLSCWLLGELLTHCCSHAAWNSSGEFFLLLKGNVM